MHYFRERKSRSLKKPSRWSNIWFKEKSLNHVVFKMQLDSLTTTPDEKKSTSVPSDEKPKILDSPGGTDLTSLLTDELLLQILSKLPKSQKNPNSLVCKRWLALQGRLVRSIKLWDWYFLDSGRIFSRFPNLTDVNLVHASVESPKPRNSGILLTHRFISIQLDSVFSLPGEFISNDNLLSPELIDRGLGVLAHGCPNLRKLVLIAATKMGLSSVAEACPMLQELELYHCTDLSLCGISTCRNLQVLKLIGNVDGLYSSVTVSDIGLTILARGCTRLVTLELSGCEGSYDGIRAIGQCCQMLEELTLGDHRIDEGWMAALSFFENLKTLRLRSCKWIDPNPGPVEHLGSCPTLETLQLQRCQLRDKQSMNALFMVCKAAKEITFQDCWGLDNEMLSMASNCRRVKLLSLEGCSLVTMEGLESVLLSWKELENLRVVSCNKLRDSEVTPALSSLYSALKQFQWRPDSRSLLASSLSGTGMGKRGSRFFKRL